MKILISDADSAITLIIIIAVIGAAIFSAGFMLGMISA